jgi:hypothetical protein
MSNTNTNRIGAVIAFLVSGVCIAAALWLFFNRQFAMDQVSVWTYQPSAAIASIGQKVEFTDKGKFIFYATKPELESQETFNKECPRQETGSPILGCYTTDDRIYVYNLTNQKLNGMEEVTAAHEMLHAVWYRTSASDREKLTTELKAAYDTLDNKELKTRMEYYQRTEPGEFANELHSILGSEVANLGEPLESYYSQFFNRSAVLALHSQYSGVYTALYERADTLFANMQTLSASIESQSTTYDTAAKQLSADIASFNDRAKNGAFTSQAQFNSERSALVQRTKSLESQRTKINGDIATYTQYYNEYQEIAKQIEVLNDSIDSFKQIEAAPSV